MKMENDAPKNVDKKTNITRIKSQVLRNVKSDNKKLQKKVKMNMMSLHEDDSI